MIGAKLKVALLYDVWNEDPIATAAKEDEPPRRKARHKKTKKKRKEMTDREEIFEALAKLENQPAAEALFVGSFAHLDPIIIHMEGVQELFILQSCRHSAMSPYPLLAFQVDLVGRRADARVEGVQAPMHPGFRAAGIDAHGEVQIEAHRQSLRAHALGGQTATAAAGEH